MQPHLRIMNRPNKTTCWFTLAYCSVLRQSVTKCACIALPDTLLLRSSVEAIQTRLRAPAVERHAMDISSKGCISKSIDLQSFHVTRRGRRLGYSTRLKQSPTSCHQHVVHVSKLTESSIGERTARVAIRHAREQTALLRRCSRHINMQHASHDWTWCECLGGTTPWMAKVPSAASIPSLHIERIAFFGSHGMPLEAVSSGAVKSNKQTAV